ncbi:MAG: glycosyltransferase [Candidatus Omnitrophica bacterium]|nr:glycosyltransferase [Candidatus Omnitrophota bacterium]
MTRVSIIIPTYNRKHLVSDAIESVLAQTYKDYEIIVVDDGSTDGTEEMIRSKYGDRLHYIRQTNQGISAARNAGIRSAKGDFIAFLDSDDMWLPEKLEKQITYLDQHSNLGFLCTRFKAYSIHNKDAVRFGPEGFSTKFAELLMSDNFIPTSTVMVRRAVLDDVGLFDPDIPTYEDFDLWLRIAKKYPFDCLQDILTIYREHPQNTGKDSSKVHWGLWKVYSKILGLYGRDIPDLDLVQKKAACYEYLVGTERLKRGEVKEGFSCVRNAFKRHLFLGDYLASSKKQSRFHAVYYCFKSYMVFAAAALLALMKGTK